MDSDPEEAARALELGKATGVDPQAIYSDVEGFEQQHKAVLAQHLLRGNPILQDYVNSHPLAAELSHDDLHNLDEASQRLQAVFGKSEVTPADSIMGRAAKAFADQFTAPQPIELTPEQIQWQKDHPFITSMGHHPAARMFAEGVHLGAQYAGQATSGAFAALHEGVKATAMQHFGMDENRADSLARELVGVVESEIGRRGTEPEAYGLEKERLAEVMKAGGPWVREGKEPPVGVNELIDKAYGEQAKLDVKNLDDIIKTAQQSATKERSPDTFEQFLAMHTDSEIGIPAEAVRKLYGDKVPEKDDNLLGFIPGIREQLQAAEPGGWDVKVPASTYIAHVDPEVHKALHDDVRVRDGGMTINETKPKVKEGDETTLTTETKPVERPPPIDVVDGVRRQAGLDPLAGPGQIQLKRVEERPGGVHEFDFNDAGGKRIGGAVIFEKDNGKNLFVSAVTAGTPRGLPGFLGTGQLSGLLRQLQQEFPNAERIGGIRVSGARPESKEIWIPLRPSAQQFENFVKHVMPEGDSEWISVGNEQHGFQYLLPTDTWTGMEGKIHDALAGYMKKIAPNFPTERFISTRGIEMGGAPARGLYVPQPGADLPFVLYSLYGEHGELRAPKDLISTVRHETIHYLKRGGFFTDDEWKTLTDAAMREDWIEKYDIEKRYGESDSPEKLAYNLEEAIAEEFGKWNQEPNATHIAKEVFQRIRDLLLAMRESVIKALGFDPKVEDLFHRIEAGEIGGREVRPGPDEDLELGAQKGFEMLEEARRKAEQEGIKEAIEAKRPKTRLEELHQRTNRMSDEEILQSDELWAYARDLFDQRYQRNKAGSFIGTLNDTFKHLTGRDMTAAETAEAATGAARHGIGQPPEGPAAQRPPKQPELPGMTRMEDRQAVLQDVFKKLMTAKEYRKYQELIDKRDAGDLEHFHAEAEKLERQRQTAEWKADEARIREESKQSLLNRPDIATDNLLRENILWGDKLKGRTRLDSDRLTPEQKALLPDDYHKSGGANPQDVAANFGYQSVDQMLQHLKELHTERGDMGPNEHLGLVAEGLTRDRMRREVGDLEKNIVEGAKDHVVSPTQLDILDQETLALATKYGKDAELPITKANLDRWTKQMFDSMPITAHDRDTYLNAAGRSGRGAETALLDGDYREAFKFKQQQAISMRMAKLAGDYAKERASFDRIAKRIAKPDYAGMENNYLAHARNILGNAGLRTGKSIQGLADDVAAAKGDLTAFTKSESDLKQVQFLIPDWIYAGQKVPLDKMTYEQFKGFSDAIKQLDKLGREDKTFTTRSEKMSLRDAVDNKAIPQIEKQGLTGDPYNPEGLRKVTGPIKEVIYGKLIQAFQVFNRWDLGNKRGWFNMNVVYPFSNAAGELSADIKRFSKRLDEAKQLLKGIDLRDRLPDLLERKSNPGEMVNMTKENAIRIIMDMGNPSNADKFMRGWGVDSGRLQTWLKDNTTKEMWDFVEAVGKIHKEIFDQLKEMIREQNGVVPDQVELHPFTDPHGIQREGWYSPMIYDQVELGRSRKASGLPAINPEDMGGGLFENGYFKTTTATGSEIRRTNYAAPTDLTLSRVPQRMSQILYDLHMRPVVINFGKMLRDTDFQHAIERHSGVAVRNMLEDWLRDIIGVSKGTSTVSDQYLNRFVDFARRNLIGSLIGLNIHTAEKHGLTAALNSVAEVGPVNFAREVKALFATGPDGARSNFQFAMDESLALQRRMLNSRESIGGQFEGLRFKDNSAFWRSRDWMLEKGSFLVGWSDLMSAVPSWLAEYKKQMIELGKEFPDKAPQEYHGTAVEIANSIVDRAHGSTAMVNRPGVMRSNNAMGRLFTSLYTVFNQMLQRNFEAYWRTEYALRNIKDRDNMEGTIRGHLGKAALLVATASLWPVLVEHMVTPDSDEKTKFGKKHPWLSKTGEYGAEIAGNTLPVAREIVHGFINDSEGLGMLDTGLKEVSSSFRDVLKGTAAMDKEHGGKTIKDFSNLIGLATGMPGEAGNVAETVFNIWMKAKQAPRGPAELYRSLTTGRATGQPDVIQRGIEAATAQGRRK